MLGEPPSRTRMAGWSRGAPTLGRGLHEKWYKENWIKGVILASLIPALQIKVGNETSRGTTLIVHNQLQIF